MMKLSEMNILYEHFLKEHEGISTIIASLPSLSGLSEVFNPKRL